MKHQKTVNTRFFNRKSIISYIMRNGCISRKQLAHKLGLTGATITNITSELINEGIISEIGFSNDIENIKAGRKEILIDMKEDFKYAIGFDVSNLKLRVTLLNIKSQVIEYKIWNYKLLTQDILNKALDFALNLKEKYAREKILGVGLLIHGYMEDNLCYSLPIKDMKKQLDFKLGINSLMMNNAKGIAVCENYFSEKNKNFLLIKYGPGLASVIVNDGVVMTGNRNRAGEIGHITWFGENCNEETCNVCGKKNCLESFVSFSSIIRNINPKNDILTYSFKDVLTLSKEDNNFALEKALNIVAEAINMLMEVIDPELVFLAGEIFEYREFYELLCKLIVEKNTFIHLNKIKSLDNYSEKRIKAAGIVVLNDFIINYNE